MKLCYIKKNPCVQEGTVFLITYTVIILLIHIYLSILYCSCLLDRAIWLNTTHKQHQK